MTRRKNRSGKPAAQQQHQESTGFAQSGPAEPIVHRTGYARVIPDAQSTRRAPPPAPQSASGPARSSNPPRPPAEFTSYTYIDPADLARSLSSSAAQPQSTRPPPSQPSNPQRVIRDFTMDDLASAFSGPTFHPTPLPSVPVPKPTPPPPAIPQGPRHVPHHALRLGLNPSVLKGKYLNHFHASEQHPYWTLGFTDGSLYKIRFETYLRIKDICPEGSSAALLRDSHLSEVLEEFEVADYEKREARPVLVEDCSFAIATWRRKMFRGLRQEIEHFVLGFKMQGRWGYVQGHFRKRCEPGDQSRMYAPYIVKLDWRGMVKEGEPPSDEEYDSDDW